jgi:hypothetical protein
MSRGEGFIRNIKEGNTSFFQANFAEKDSGIDHWIARTTIAHWD